MAKGITFPNKPEANEYAKAMKERGWDTLLHHDTTIVAGVKTDAWTVHVSAMKEGKRMPSGKIPESIAEIIEQEEAETPKEFWPRQTKRLGRGAVATRKGITQAADEAALATARGETLTPILQRTSKRMDVVSGMKRAIPVPGGGRHGYLARIGEMGPAKITEGVGSYSPRIAGTANSGIRSTGGMPLIAGTGLGVPPDMRFQTTPDDLRFQVPRTRKLRVGNDTFPEPKENEEEERI